MAFKGLGLLKVLGGFSVGLVGLLGLGLSGLGLGYKGILDTADGQNPA